MHAAKFFYKHFTLCFLKQTVLLGNEEPATQAIWIEALYFLFPVGLLKSSEGGKRKTSHDER